MVVLTRTQFEALVEDALIGLPEEFLQHMQNVAVTVADWPSPGELKRAGVAHPLNLFGLYEGVPLTKRGTNYNLVAPDRIILYQDSLQMASHSLPALRERIRDTVVHEIAHHFGISEARIRELGY